MGETTNYIFNRAYVEAKPAEQVLLALREELSVAGKNIAKTMGSVQALEIWKEFEYGYMYVIFYIFHVPPFFCHYSPIHCSTWHLEQSRYKLKDLEL